MMENIRDDDTIDRALAVLDDPPAEAPERTALADPPNPAPMPDVHSDTPVALVERAFKALCEAGADLTNAAQLADIQDQEGVLAKAADELHSLRISLEGIDPGAYVIARANDVEIPIPAQALMMPKRAEVQRHLEKLQFHCREFSAEWERRLGLLNRAAATLDTAAKLSGTNGGDGAGEADTRVDDGVREMAQRFRPRPAIARAVEIEEK